MIFKKIRKKGFSIVEILIAISIFLILTTGTFAFTLQTIQANKNARYRTQAYLQIQQVQNALTIKKKESWKNITTLTNLGDYHITLTNGVYDFASGAGVQDGLTTKINVGAAYRDSSNNLTDDTNQTNDPGSRKVTINISWVDLMGVTRSLVSNLVVTDWNVAKWSETNSGQFDLGTKEFVVTDTNGGELKMENIAYPDWCKPKFSTTPLNLPGSGIADAITAIQDRACIGT